MPCLNWYDKVLPHEEDLQILSEHAYFGERIKRNMNKLNETNKWPVITNIADFKRAI